MATYKLWLTVKDVNGNTKEIDGGTVNVDLTKLTEAEAAQVAATLDLESYATDADLEALAKEVPTVIETKIPEMIPAAIKDNVEVQEALTDVVEEKVNTIKYDSFTSD